MKRRGAHTETAKAGRDVGQWKQLKQEETWSTQKQRKAGRDVEHTQKTVKREEET